MYPDDLVGGRPTPLKNMKVSWDDDIPNLCKNKKNVPNHQPDYQDRNYCLVPKHLRLAWSAVSNTRNGKLLHNELERSTMFNG